ncbi:MAG TPA: glutathione S-transferase family protein [Acetobacteraceae bacterium]
MTARPVLYGATYSVYVRAVRLALHEKAVPYEQVEVDVFAPTGPPEAYLARHPFGRIPAFEHEGFHLYEAGAIERYVDEAFPGPPLQPNEPRARARMTQAISVLDSYAYPTLVRTIFVEQVRAPSRGQAPDEARIAAALPRAATCLHALAEISGGGPWLAGNALTLADLHAAPMLTYFRMAPDGAALLNACPPLAAWLDRMAVRPSMQATRSPLES